MRRRDHFRALREVLPLDRRPVPHDCDRARDLALRVLARADRPGLDRLLRLYLAAHLDCKEV